MKLTKQQISELTETQLNLAMIWCYPPEGRSYMTVSGGGVYYNQRNRRFYEWLSNWDILMPLVVENELGHTLNHDFIVMIHHQGYWLDTFHNKSLQRAYCEALVYLKVGV